MSNVTSSEILAVNESQPLGGPKYYIATNTKSGEAKVIHEAMPTMATPMSSSFAVAEEMVPKAAGRREGEAVTRRRGRPGEVCGG